MFQCGSLWFSLPAVAVREVAARPPFVRVPNSHSALAGLCHLRNEFLPVLSLQTLLNHDAQRDAVEQQMIVLAAPHATWALLVDDVAALEPLDVSINTDCRSDDIWSSVMVGAARWRGQVIRVLDPKALYRLAESELAQPCQRQPAFSPSNTANTGQPHDDSCGVVA